ncbi:MAG: phenylalanine--tRNA ligase subunit beta [Peptoniphilus sp.]|nr:phenylalanine--tRNA ligase subunit beta [Peptoniphilus sp.]MDD7362527.1 phenylalanine--tRNA ligase subunit beta [Bacillota bacterium]MDY6045074.1 phenylalanine--tRNA ligase subunit beta [Peptoniphilus sp.]
MLLPKSWLEKYVTLEGDTREIADEITESGNHVESIMLRSKGLSGIVVGKILKIEPHPNADKLVVCQVDIGGGVVKQILTAAPNVFEGATVPVALDGAKLAGGVEIHDTTMRGLPSEGMMCSLEEVGMDQSVVPKASRDGIHILEGDVEPGTDYIQLLELDKEVIELEITPNRPDCLSIRGMAVETAASTDSVLSMDDAVVDENSDVEMKDKFNGLHVETEFAPRFYLRMLTDVVVEPSPQWLQNDLMAAGVRPINNIVDLTNYVMLEYGQPLHAYDLDALEGPEIHVRLAKEGETMETLDGNEHTLSKDDIVIADNGGIIGLAGVMGGAISGVQEGTHTVVLEGANFDAGHIRKTSKRQAIRSEASTRFEKGLDPNRAKEAVDRVCELAVEIGAAKVAKGSFDHYPEELKPWIVDAEVDRINALLGTDISGEEMARILESLLIETELDEGTLHATIPTFRGDLHIWEDLAEEVGRIYGFGNIEPIPLKGTLTRGGKSPYRRIEKKAQELLLAAGFNEFMTYSFMGPSAFDRIRLKEDDPLRDAVKISNPLGEEFSIMRTTLLPNMLDIFVKNMSYKNPSAYGFEFGNVFTVDKDAEGLPKEFMKLAIGFYGDDDFYFLKETIATLLSRLGIDGLRFVQTQSFPLFHKGRQAEVFIHDESVGIFGCIHPKAQDDLGLKQPVYLAELDFSKIVEHVKDDVTYKPIARFPSMERDLAFILDKKLPAQDLLDFVEERGGELLESVDVFDVYFGKGIEEGKKSIALKLEFRHPDRTLKEEEITTTVDELISGIEEHFHARLRSK